jgi:HAD superfamily hydrolase (TIGR01509 family)
VPTSNPTNTIIIFDIHGVVFKNNYARIARLLLSNKQTLRLLLHAFHPCVVYDVMRLWWAGSVTEKYYTHLITTYPTLAPCSSLMTNVANAQTPIAATVAIVKELKARGYTLHIVSNIGHYFLTELQHHYPDIFAYFDVIQVASPANNYLGKPDKRVYECYKQEHNLAGKQMIFIDDKRRNVCAAQQVGMIGVRYTNPAELKKQLDALLEAHR